MSAPCHNDTCSIEWTTALGESGGQAYEATVVLDPDGGLVCTEDEGVGVLVDPAAGNLLSLSGAGLMATQVGAVVEQIENGNYQAIPITADENSPIVTQTFTSANPLGRGAIAVLRGTMNWFYTVTADFTNPDLEVAGGGASGLTAYNAQMRGRIFTNTSGSLVSPSISQWTDISGVVNTGDTGGSQDKGQQEQFVVYQNVPAGGTLYFAADTNYQGPDQRVNVGFSPVSQSSPARGFRLQDCEVLWIPA